MNFRVNLMREESPEVKEDDLVKLRLDVPGHGDLTIWGNDKLALILDDESRCS